jgi:uncharacterized protein (DUF427 family)
MSREHYADIVTLNDEFVLTVKGREIARSNEVKELRETHPRAFFHPVYYFPPGSVDTQWLKKTEHHTTCPIKGIAHYWSIVLPEKEYKNAVWSYPPGDSRDDSSEVVDHFAFDINQGLELYRNGERVTEQGIDLSSKK